MFSSAAAVPPAAPGPALVVGVVHDFASLLAAGALPPPGAPATPDLLELRADAFVPELLEGAAGSASSEPLRQLLAAPPRPLLLTVRHPREGGQDRSLGPAARRLALLRRLLPRASWVDVELRSLLAPAPAAAEFRALLAGARAHGCRVVVSFHDFRATPTVRRLRALRERARDLGVADVFKVATTLAGPADLARLFVFLEEEKTAAPPLSLAVMGMGAGPLACASRLALAAAGSRLNYGFLGDAAPVPGQWPAGQLRALLDELSVSPPPPGDDAASA